MLQNQLDHDELAGLAFQRCGVVIYFSFAAASPLLAVLAFMLPSHALEIQAGNLFQAIGRERMTLLLMLASLPVFFALLSLGAIGWGMTGASVGFVAASWIMGIVEMKRLPDAALPFSSSPHLVWAIRLATGLLFVLVLWRPESDAVYCLLLAGAALTALCGSGIVKALSFRRIASAMS